MSDRSQIEAACRQYFEAINTDDVSNLPLAERVEYSGTVMPEAIVGASAVREHLQQTAPFILNMVIEELIIEGNKAAAIANFEGVNKVKLQGAYFLQFTDEKISRIEAIFDSRPLFAGSQN